MNLRRKRLDGYEGDRQDVQEVVPTDARRILELGCSSGRLGQAIKRRQPATVVGVEMDEIYASDAEARLDTVYCSTVEVFLAELPRDIGLFDCLIAADVLEHLTDPWSVLRQVVSLLLPGATVIISVPNILYWPEFRRLFTEKRWPRDDAGIFDRTHLRWFTHRDAAELAEGAGLHVRCVVPNYWVRGPKLALSRALSRTPVWPFVAPQHLVVASVPGSREKTVRSKVE